MVLDHRLLEAACGRPQQTIFRVDAYAGLYEKAAALMDSLARNHPFQDGNKRAAFLGAMAFLALNGEPADREFDEDEAYALTLSVVHGEPHLRKIAQLLAILVYEGQ